MLESFMEQYFDLFDGKLSFIWHGGEPLIVGIDYFRRIVEIQQRLLKKSQRIRNSVQTNGTLINDEWAKFFSEHDFRVGISLDGARESHDRFRRNTAGGSTHDRILESVKILQARGLSPGFIQTLTASNLDNVEADFRFLANVVGATHWGINVYHSECGGGGIMQTENVSPGDYSNYLKRLIFLWMEYNSADIGLREIDSHLCGVLGKKARNCSFNGECTSFFCLEHNGRIYPCDRSSDREDLLLGDFTKSSLQEILQSKERLDYVSRVDNIHEECRQCDWQNVCNNGCTMHRDGSIDGKYYYCQSRKDVLGYLKTLTTDHESGLDERR